MLLYNFAQIVAVFYFSLSGIYSLKPIKLPSGQDRVYKYNRSNPELDLKNNTNGSVVYLKTLVE